MTTFHIVGLVILILLLCLMAFLWLADGAPLVDEHEQILQEPRPDFENYRPWFEQ